MLLSRAFDEMWIRREILVGASLPIILNVGGKNKQDNAIIGVTDIPRKEKQELVKRTGPVYTQTQRIYKPIYLKFRLSSLCTRYGGRYTDRKTAIDRRSHVPSSLREWCR